MTTIKINKQQVLVRLWRKGNPSAQLVGMQTAAATVENNMEFPKKTKNGTFMTQQFTSGNISEEIQNTDSKEYMHPYVLCSVTHNSQDLEAAQVPISK